MVVEWGSQFVLLSLSIWRIPIWPQR